MGLLKVPHESVCTENNKAPSETINVFMWSGQYFWMLLWDENLL